MIENRCVNNVNELKVIFALRQEVFVKEQGVPIQDELDEFDSDSKHIACCYNGRIVGCGRLYVDNKVAHLGRICVLKSFRGLGLGSSLCEYLCQMAIALSCKMIELNAQIQAIHFYQKMGFKTIGNEFMDAGIPHIRMIKTVK